MHWGFGVLGFWGSRVVLPLRMVPPFCTECGLVTLFLCRGSWVVILENHQKLGLKILILTSLS